MTKSVNSLIADLDAEFGKASKQKKQPKFSTARDLNKTFHQRNSTGTVSDMLHASNMTAKSWAQEPGYMPIRRVTYIVHQHCKVCSHSISYIGNVFTEFENKRLRSVVKAPELILVDSLGFELPHLTEEVHQDVEECVSCISLSRKIDDLLVVLEVTNQPTLQKPLAFGDHYVEPAKSE